MSTQNEAHTDWLKRHSVIDRALRRANTEFVNATGAVRDALRRGRQDEARELLPGLQTARLARDAAIDAWLAVVGEDTPNRVP